MQCLIQSGSDTSRLTDIDKAPRPSISNNIWILSSDICQLNQLFSNSEAAIIVAKGVKISTDQFFPQKN